MLTGTVSDPVGGWSANRYNNRNSLMGKQAKSIKFLNGHTSSYSNSTSRHLFYWNIQVEQAQSMLQPNANNFNCHQ